MIYNSLSSSTCVRPKHRLRRLKSDRPKLVQFRLSRSGLDQFRLDRPRLSKSRQSELRLSRRRLDQSKSSRSRLGRSRPVRRGQLHHHTIKKEPSQMIEQLKSNRWDWKRSPYPIYDLFYKISKKVFDRIGRDGIEWVFKRRWTAFQRIE